MLNKKEIRVGSGIKLSIDDCFKVAVDKVKVQLDKKSKTFINSSNKILKNYIQRKFPIYGLSTQFGDQVNLLDQALHYGNNKNTSESTASKRQYNLIRSHNCGVGPESPQEYVRAAMLLRAQCLSQGHSGVRVEPINQLIHFLNFGIHPVVKKYGSIGASGDLIPLSGIASALIGDETDVIYENKKFKADTLLKKLKIKPLTLKGREGLALINGTSFMTGITAVAFHDLKSIFWNMLAVISFCLEALGALDSGYKPIVHKLKGHKGEIEVNNYILRCLQGSKLIRNLEKERLDFIKNLSQKKLASNGKSLQDYYSVRSVSQGFGPFLENMKRSQNWIEDEMNSVNDNPIIDTQTKEIHHSANFMGYYTMEACDILKANISQASSWLHALLANMVHPRKSHYLPTNLIQSSAINNGFRPLQILVASLVVQNRKLAQSQQSFMISTEGDNQDVNSLGTHAAFDFRESVENLSNIVSVMFMASIQALVWRDPKNTSIKFQKVYKKYQNVYSYMKDDRFINNELIKISQILKSDII